MQNRLATAILMSLGGALDHMGKEIPENFAGELLGLVAEYTRRLLNNEVVNTNASYPLMQLTGSNLVQQSYNEVAKELLQSENEISAQQRGYNE